MKKPQLEIMESRIYDWESIKRMKEIWRFLGKRTVFTNGCFDILHLGHIEYLSKAADQGDILIVGLNTDASVKRIKGGGRPINNEKARALTLAALKFVDAVVLFDQDTPIDIIRLVEPDVLVKGSDYREETIVGADVVKARGGEVITIELVPGFSTSGIIDKIKHVGE
jgi:rfaE bifunctional protein nucleotidyltransferase chain/domain